MKKNTKIIQKKFFSTNFLLHVMCDQRTLDIPNSLAAFSSAAMMMADIIRPGSPIKAAPVWSSSLYHSDKERRVDLKKIY